MALLEDLGIDLDTVNVAEVEEQIKAGPLAPEGYHHAVLEGFREGSANNGRKFRELKFKIVAGPGKDQEVKESLWNSDEAKGKNRVLLFAHRLGLYQRDANGKLRPVAGKSEFSDVVGAQCVIEVKHKSREYEKDGEKKKTTDAILSFEGVLALDDPRCKDIARASGAAVATATASIPPAQPKPAFDDL